VKSDISYSSILRLATPIVIANLSQMVLGIIDTAMVGAVNSTLLASAALVNSLLAIPTILGIGLAIGLSPLLTVSQGAGNKALFRKYFQNGLLLCVAFSVLLAGLIQLVSPIIFHLGQEHEVAVHGEPYLKIMGWSVVPMIAFLTLKQTSDALEKTTLPMVISLSVIPINVFLNYLLIYGKLGFPALELNGAGYATLISRVLMFLSLAACLIHEKVFRSILDDWTQKWDIQWSTLLKILKIGIPTSMQYAMESWAFAFSGIMMGWLGSKSLAAHQIALNIASFTFMGAMGIASAGSIKVGIEFGKNQLKNVRIAGLNTLRLSIWYGLITAVLFILFRNWIPLAFNSETEVVKLASILLVFAAIFQISDSAQTTGVSICRGIQDVATPTLMVFIAYWIIGIPLGYLLTFQFHIGPYGIWIGFLAGLSASAVLLNLRFFNHSIFKNQKDSTF
jgi:multidrug resistance protein, MATE family